MRWYILLLITFIASVNYQHQNNCSSDHLYFGVTSGFFISKCYFVEAIDSVFFLESYTSEKLHLSFQLDTLRYEKNNLFKGNKKKRNRLYYENNSIYVNDVKVDTNYYGIKRSDYGGFIAFHKNFDIISITQKRNVLRNTLVVQKYFNINFGSEKVNNFQEKLNHIDITKPHDEFVQEFYKAFE